MNPNYSLEEALRPLLSKYNEVERNLENAKVASQKNLGNIMNAETFGDNNLKGIERAYQAINEVKKIEDDLSNIRAVIESTIREFVLAIMRETDKVFLVDNVPTLIDGIVQPRVVSRYGIKAGLTTSIDIEEKPWGSY